MHRLPPGTLLRCVNTDHVDEPRDHPIEVDDIVIVTSQAGDGYGHTTMFSLMQGVFVVVEYSHGCIYDLMGEEACYEVYEP
jgi:hypothetical protein